MKLPTLEARRTVCALALAAACLPALFAVPCAVRAAEPAAAKAPKPQLTAKQASQRYKRGQQLERKHRVRLAMAAYHESAEAGNGYAQRKLGDIYGNGNTVVRRDYETSLKWYDKAREQGIEVPSPPTMPLEPKFAQPKVR